MILTKKNYHSVEANKLFMGQGQYKGYRKCEAKQQAKVDGTFVDETTPDMLIGSFFHAWSEGLHAVAEFKIEHPEIFKKNGELLANFKHVEKMISRVENDEFCMFVLQGEKERIFTAEMFGVQWKIMMDVYAPEMKRYVEIKTTKNISGLIWDEELHAKVSFIDAYGYMAQATVYLEIERLATGRDTWLEPIMLAVSKEPEPDKEIISLKDDDRMMYELEQIKENMPRIIAVKSGQEEPIRCEKCDYCRSTKKISKIVHYTELGGY